MPTDRLVEWRDATGLVCGWADLTWTPDTQVVNPSTGEIEDDDGPLVSLSIVNNCTFPVIIAVTRNNGQVWQERTMAALSTHVETWPQPGPVKRLSHLPIWSLTPNAPVI